MESRDKYSEIIEERAEEVFDAMARRVTPAEVERIREAFEFAREAHAPQKRKSGEPYIFHPIAVAHIAATEMMLGANPVIAAFLHDVVEDTPATIADIRRRFGDDVAGLVDVVTKRKKEHYEMSKQLDNYRQILDSVRYDIRAVLLKLADRLHNMRTLSSMTPAKQMKIAGETDYFYAPLANRLGLYNIKTELENLSFRFRCPDDYEHISSLMERHIEANRENLNRFTAQMAEALKEAGIDARIRLDYRRPYSLWRKMSRKGIDFGHLNYRHFIEVIFPDDPAVRDKTRALQIYSVLSDRFREKHNSLSNYIDSPKENGYRSIHVKLMPDFGRWQEVHISSESMIRQSQLGCVAERSEENVGRWIEKFRKILYDINQATYRGADYMEDVVYSFYNDDIMVFDHRGRSVVLPQQSTAIDLAYELGEDTGNHARYAIVNGRLEPMTVALRRGDTVEVKTDAEARPQPDWEGAAHTYKARKAIREWLESLPRPAYTRCPHCAPIPGQETIGIRDHDNPQRITIHARHCPEAITLASSFGDDVADVPFEADGTLYSVDLTVRAVDRHHLLIDLVDCITNTLGLSIESFNTETTGGIVTCRVRFGVHSDSELKAIVGHIERIPMVDEVRALPV